MTGIAPRHAQQAADSAGSDSEASASRALFERFAAIIDSSQDAIVSKSLDGTLTSWNPAAERLFGYSAAEAIGRSIMMLIPPDRVGEEAQIIERLQRGERIQHLRTRRRHKAGHLIDVELTISPLRDTGGRIIGASKIARDIGPRLEQERLLRYSEELYRSLVQASGAIAFRTDPHGRLAVTQPTWEAYTGQPFEAYAGDGWLGAVHPDDRERVAADVARAVATGTRFETHGRLWHAASATYRWVEARSLPLRDPGGAVREWIGTCTDVHERRLAEEDSARLARELRLLTDALPALVSYVDAQQRYRFNNRGYQDWFGEPAQALHGRHLSEVLGASAYARIRPHVERALQGQRVRFEDEPAYRSGGARYVRADYVPDLRPDGTVAGFFALIYDISDSKRAELALRESEERYRMVVDSQVEMLCRFRPDGTILFVNASYARTLGTTPSELIGRSFWNYIGEDDRAAVQAMLESLSPSRPERQIENRLLTAAGERWTLWTNRGLVFDESGRVVEAQSSGIDITDRKRVEEQLEAIGIENARLLEQAQRQAQQLRELDRRKDEFLALLSHELRNPLAPIRTCLDILQGGPLSGDTMRRTLAVMDRQTRNLTRLVDDLLEVTRFTRGLIELRRATLDLRAVVQESIDICRPLLDERGHRLELDLPGEAIPLDGDQTRLTQVVANLLNNAAKYTPPGGIVGLKLAVQDREAVLQVSDNGTGIPADMLTRIFELFTRIDSSLERSSEGLGIGLSLAERLVKLHGGTIEAASDGRGCGSTFTVRLPLA
ncbi:MAG: PAS domain S-box protein [Gammaproteobacteria bacterium]